MPTAVIAIALIISTFFFGGSFMSRKKAVTPPADSPIVSQTLPQKPFQSPVKKKVSPAPPTKTSTISPDTFIKYGPLEKEILTETNRIIFEFSSNKSQAIFETKIDGFDQTWQETYSTERTVDLPAGFKTYTFFVRAKINGVVDPTPAKRTFTIKVSPYFKKVAISGLKAPVFPQPSLITLSANFYGNEKIGITGWRLMSTTTQKSFVIPQGVEKYDPQNPLFVENIFIKPSDTIYISSATGQMLGRTPDFRLNKCFGYLIPLSNFVIAIPENCPWPREDRLPRNLSDACQNYVKNRRSCESTNSESLAKFNVSADSICLSYIETTFNYPSCLANYQNDSDFYAGQWHIYTGTAPDREIMNSVFDTVYLLDQNGLFVDKYKYGY